MSRTKHYTPLVIYGLGILVTASVIIMVGNIPLEIGNFQMWVVLASLFAFSRLSVYYGRHTVRVENE